MLSSLMSPTRAGHVARTDGVHCDAYDVYDGYDGCGYEAHDAKCVARPGAGESVQIKHIESQIH